MVNLEDEGLSTEASALTTDLRANSAQKNTRPPKEDRVETRTAGVRLGARVWVKGEVKLILP